MIGQIIRRPADRRKPGRACKHPEAVQPMPPLPESPARIILGDMSTSVRGLFITGTDTGVGKTHVAAMIARALCAVGAARRRL